jgi:SAM-dependent methyltransferase
VRLRGYRALFAATRRSEPVSRHYGLERGRPIDRYYIERFLERESFAIRGTCLEVGDNEYTYRYGGDRVSGSDVLDIDASNSRATIHGDLRRLVEVVDGGYDCVILTQVLQFVDDREAAVRECRRILKTDGVLLATVPAMSRLDMANEDYWRFTAAGARHLFTGIFGEGEVAVEAHGNALAGLAFWLGLAQEDLSPGELDLDDPDFPCLVTVRAAKADTPGATV